MSPKRYKPQRRLRTKRSLVKKILQSRFFWLGLLVCFAFAGVGYGVLFTPVFQIKQVEVEGNQKIAKDQIVQLTNKFLLRNFAFFEINHFLLVDNRNLEREIRETFPEIDFVAVKKKFPHALKVNVRERQKVAVWCQQKNYTVEVEDSESSQVRSFRQCFSLDRNGVVFEEVEPQDDMIISAENGEGMLGKEVVNPEVLSYLLEFQRAIDSFALFQEVGLRISSLHIVSRERVNAKISEGWEMYINPMERLDWQITKAKLVLEKEIPSNKRPFLAYIDLRFGDQAYLKYRN